MGFNTIDENDAPIYQGPLHEPDTSEQLLTPSTPTTSAFDTLGSSTKRFQDLYPGDYSNSGPYQKPPDYIGESAIRNAPMMQPAPTSYEQRMPFEKSVSWFNRLVNPNGEKEAWLQRGQQYDTQQQQNARQNATTEANLYKAIEATDPGQRGPLIKTVERFYKAQGIQLDPLIGDFLKKADQQDLAVAQQTTQMLSKELGLSPEDTGKLVNGTQAGAIKFFEAFARIKKFKADAEKHGVETERGRLVNTLIERSVNRPRGVLPPTGAPTPSMPSSQPEGFQGPPQRGLTQVQQKVVAEAQRQGVDPAAALAFYQQESPTGANGDGGKAARYFQLHEPAAIDAGKVLGIHPSLRWDENGNIALGVQYVKQKLAQGGGDIGEAGKYYNWGTPTWQGKGVKDYPQQIQQKYAQAEEQLQGLPKPHMQGVDAASPQEKATIIWYDNQINEAQQHIKEMLPASGVPEIDKMLDNERQDLKLLIDARKEIEARFNPPVTPDLNAYSKDNFDGRAFNQLAPAEQRQARRGYEEEKQARHVEGLQKQGENAAAMKELPEAHLYLDENKKPGKVVTVGQLVKEQERRQKAQEPPLVKWEALKPESQVYTKTEQQAAGIKGIQRVMKYLDDPNTAKLVGSLMTNPGAGIEKTLANVFGKTIPDKYREVAAEIAHVTSGIIHDAIGGAQTPTEYERLKPIIGSMDDPNPATLKAKMRTLHNAMAEDYNTRLEGFDAGQILAPRNWKPFTPLGATQSQETKTGAPERRPNPLAEALK